MASTQPPSDTPVGPLTLVAGGYSDVIGLIQEFEKALNLPRLVNISREVLDLPPDERFRNSIDVFKQAYGIEFDEEIHLDNVDPRLVELLQRLEQEGLPKLFNILNRAIRDLQRDELEQVIHSRSQAQEYAIMGLFFAKLESTFGELERFYFQSWDDESSFEEKMRYVSLPLPLYCRFVLIAVEHQTQIDEDMLRDILRADYYRAKLVGLEHQQHPEEVSIKTVWEEVIESAAALAYSELGISVSRGAELAELPIKEFETYLIEQGIKPRYGPDSDEELSEGISLS